MEKDRRDLLHPKRIESITPTDITNSVAWRILARSRGISLRMFEKMAEEQQLLSQKPDIIEVNSRSDKIYYQKLAEKYRQITGKDVMTIRATGTFSHSTKYFFLEPLTETEKEEAMMQEQSLILPPDQLIQILEITD